jgi:hypothetical protein
MAIEIPASVTVLFSPAFLLTEAHGAMSTVNGGWSEWLPWDECSQTCGQGQRSRMRECNNPVPSYDGHLCSGESREFEYCNLRPCPGL